MSSLDGLMTIGTVAELTGRRPSSIRCYEQISLLLAARRVSGRLRELAARKRPEITALIARTEIVRGWLESAARCECPSLDECPLFDDPALPGKTQGS